MKNWTINYNNDVSADDEGFCEWWEITDGEKTFKSDDEKDADFLCNLLNIVSGEK
jgi:hypothetical protein